MTSAATKEGIELPGLATCSPRRGCRSHVCCLTRAHSKPDTEANVLGRKGTDKCTSAEKMTAQSAPPSTQYLRFSTLRCQRVRHPRVSTPQGGARVTWVYLRCQRSVRDGDGRPFFDVSRRHHTHLPPAELHQGVGDARMVEHRRLAVKTDTQSGMGQRLHVASGGLRAAKCRYGEGICADLRFAYAQARGGQGWNRHECCGGGTCRSLHGNSRATARQ